MLWRGQTAAGLLLHAKLETDTVMGARHSRDAPAEGPCPTPNIYTYSTISIPRKKHISSSHCLFCVYMSLKVQTVYVSSSHLT